MIARQDANQLEEEPGRQLGGPLEVLRVNTREMHERLHRLPAFAALADGTLSRSGYGELMMRLLSFYRAFDRRAEEGLAMHAGCFAGYRYRPRAALISADLKRLRQEGAASAGNRIEAPLACCGGAAALAGMLYVVDGSMLGGSLLSRSAIGITGSDDACGYWLWCRRDGAEQWRALKRVLPMADTGEGARATMVDAALATFKAFGDCFAVAPRPQRGGN